MGTARVTVENSTHDSIITHDRRVQHLQSLTTAHSTHDKYKSSHDRPVNHKWTISIARMTVVKVLCDLPSGVRHPSRYRQTVRSEKEAQCPLEDAHSHKSRTTLVANLETSQPLVNYFSLPAKDVRNGLQQRLQQRRRKRL